MQKLSAGRGELPQAGEPIAGEIREKSFVDHLATRQRRRVNSTAGPASALRGNNQRCDVPDRYRCTCLSDQSDPSPQLRTSHSRGSACSREQDVKKISLRFFFIHWAGCWFVLRVCHHIQESRRSETRSWGTLRGWLGDVETTICNCLLYTPQQAPIQLRSSLPWSPPSATISTAHQSQIRIHTSLSQQCLPAYCCSWHVAPAQRPFCYPCAAFRPDAGWACNMEESTGEPLGSPFLHRLPMWPLPHPCR